MNILHTLHAAQNGASTVIIRSPDTDVAVIGCALVLFHIGTKERKRYISLTALAEKLGADACNALPGLHAFTGCNTTSSFLAREKEQLLLLLMLASVMQCNSLASYSLSPRNWSPPVSSLFAICMVALTCQM